MISLGMEFYLGGMWWFIFLASSLVLFPIFYFIFRKRTYRTQWVFLFTLLIINFITHIAAPFYIDIGVEHSWRRILLNNICAVNVFLFPIIFLTRSNFLKISIICLGFVSGLVSLITAEPIVNGVVFQYANPDANLDLLFFLETARFYFQHAVLWLVPCLMLAWGHYKIKVKHLWMPALYLTGIFFIIIANDVIAYTLGLQPTLDYYNGGMQWAPHDSFRVFFDFLLIPLFTTVPFGPNAGTEMLWPIIYIIPAVLLYMTAVSFVVYLLDRTLFRLMRGGKYAPCCDETPQRCANCKKGSLRKKNLCGLKGEGRSSIRR